MKAKQIIITIVILILGVLIGRFAFSNNTDNNTPKSETKVQHWTCSMHPEIDLLEFGPCPKCGMDLIPKESSDGLHANEFKLSKNAIALANIQTMIIGENSFDKDVLQNVSTIKLSGKIAVNDKASAIQTAHFGGRIEKLNYKSIGEYVKKGSLVAIVYSPELVTAQNEFIEALNIKNAQPELYKAVRNKLKNWKISENQILKIERTKKVITNFKMYANVSGYIDEILIQEGNHINEGSALFKVSNLTSVWAVFDVYEQDIKYLKIGQKIRVKSNAYPDKEINAKINFIDPNLNINTRAVSVRATLSNKNNRLKPGMILSAIVQLSNKKKSDKINIEVPKTAVLWTGKRSVVYVKNATTIFELREVTLGNANEKNYQIISGLENSEEIVINGTFTVDAAAQLQGKPSMMNSKIEEIKKENDDVVVERIEVHPKFKKQLNVVFQDYIKLKDAFVLTDAKKVSQQAKNLSNSIKKVSMKLLKKPTSHEIWMGILPKIKSEVTIIQSEMAIEKQRNSFINLSKEILNLATNFGVNKTLYVQHCPMANDNKGADWLSFEKEIKNPYFGDKMLQCGSVERTIK